MKTLLNGFPWGKPEAKSIKCSSLMSVLCSHAKKEATYTTILIMLIAQQSNHGFSDYILGLRRTVFVLVVERANLI
jgi:hypothetical protein